MAITGPVIVRAADGLKWQASHREAEIGAVSTRPSTLFGFTDKDAGISLRASYRTSVRDFHSPRHKHTFDQVRYILSGFVKYGREVYGPETCLYLPEGVPYGPMQSHEDSIRTSVGLQFPGPSRIPYPSSADIARAREELSQLGEFEKGIFCWADGRKQDSFEAIAERLMGEELSYPPPRYKDYLVMNAENYTWQPLKNTSGVFVKHLGYFNEVGPNIKVVRMEPGASTQPGFSSWQQVRFIVEGEVSYEQQTYEAVSCMYFPAGKSYTATTTSKGAKLFIVQLASPAGEAPPYCVI
jgi:hypothetical protein